ncbi:MAG: tetratricopeptide repeat protein, partial [Cyanobacteria bacterium P01_F01_bin.150]
MTSSTVPADSLSHEDVYRALVRSLRRHEGFGLLFVQCTPARANGLVEELTQDLPLKNLGSLDLTEPIQTLYDRVAQRDGVDTLDILVVTGLDKSLEADIKPGYNGDGDYYNLNTVPPILAHLNQQRETFRDHFNHLCFVFPLPFYGVKYFIRRAPDFFDWGKGVFELPTHQDMVKQESTRLLAEGEYQKYLQWTQTERDQRILEIQTWLDASDQSSEQQEYLWFEQGNLFHASKRYEEAIASYDKAIEFKPDNDAAWSNRGNALSALGRKEEAIASYDKAIEFKPDNDAAWSNRGNALSALGRKE